MELMEIRRGLMMGMASMIPSNICISSFTIKKVATTHQIPHKSKTIPDMFFLIPKTEPIVPPNDVNIDHYPLLLLGVNATGSGIADYPNVLSSDYKKSNGVYGSVRSNQGWYTDSTYIYIKLGWDGTRIPAQEYTLIEYIFES